MTQNIVLVNANFSSYVRTLESDKNTLRITNQLVLNNVDSHIVRYFVGRIDCNLSKGMSFIKSLTRLKGTVNLRINCEQVLSGTKNFICRANLQVNKCVKHYCSSAKKSMI